MPDLPNVGWERDLESFAEFFENPAFRSDGLKVRSWQASRWMYGSPLLSMQVPRSVLGWHAVQTCAEVPAPCLHPGFSNMLSADLFGHTLAWAHIHWLADSGRAY